MRSAVVVSLLVSIAIGLFLYSKIASLNSTVREQQKQIQALQEKLAARTKTELVDLQERCAKQAEHEFLSLGYKRGGMDSYTSHYNAEMNKCFILIESNYPDSVYRTLFDAYGGRLYGQFIWHAVEGKKRGEIRPTACKVTLPSGEEKSCTSIDEFDALIKVYMR